MDDIRRKKSVLHNKKKTEKIFILAMIIIPICNFLLFWVYTNFNSILYAFQNVDSSGTKYWTFEQFANIKNEFKVENSPLIEALKNTMIFFASNLIIVLPISFLMCYFVYKRIFMYRTFRIIFYLPSIISASILVVLFKYIISAKGPVGLLTKAMGKDYIEFLTSSKYALKTILIYTIMTSFGGNMVLLGGAMNRIDGDLIDAGKVDGVNMFQELIYIIVPSIWPTLSTMIIFLFVGLFGSSGPILLFTQGSYGTNTLSFFIYMQVYEGTSYYYPAAIGIVLTLIGTPIALGMRALLNRFDNGVE